MPEGHSVHRITRQFGLHFVGKTISVSSPQGRFAGGASEIDGLEMTDAKAVGNSSGATTAYSSTGVRSELAGPMSRAMRSKGRDS